MHDPLPRHGHAHSQAAAAAGERSSETQYEKSRECVLTYTQLLWDLQREAQKGRGKIWFQLKRGPIKHPRRAIQKLVRSYERDSGCLTGEGATRARHKSPAIETHDSQERPADMLTLATDLVRCSVLFKTLEDIDAYMEVLTSMLYVGIEDEENATADPKGTGESRESDKSMTSRKTAGKQFGESVKRDHYTHGSSRPGTQPARTPPSLAPDPADPRTGKWAWHATFPPRSPSPLPPSLSAVPLRQCSRSGQCAQVSNQ